MFNFKKIKIINIIKFLVSIVCYWRVKIKKNNNYILCFIVFYEVDGYMMNVVYVGKVYLLCGGLIVNNWWSILIFNKF